MSRYLLDTHVALWWWTDLARLGRDARAIMEDGRHELTVSAVSAFEISLKWGLGKLPTIADPGIHYPRLMRENNFVSLSITETHALKAGLLPGDHRDPFDRMIAAQALVEDMPVITRDPAIATFGCKVIW